MLSKFVLPPLMLLLSAPMFIFPAAACTDADVAALIDRTGQQLRDIGVTAQHEIDQKVRALAKKNGWADIEVENNVAPLINSPQDQPHNEKAAGLLMQLDRLGDEAAGTIPACDRVQQAEAAARELIATSAARNARVIARLDAAMTPASAGNATMARTEKPKASPPRTPAETNRRVQKPAQGQVQRPGQTATAIRPAPPANWQSMQRPWSTQTVDNTPPPATTPAPPPTWNNQLPPRPADPTFSAEEIADAGRGFFGSISSNLASVIQYAIDQYGRPTGYILGTEGSGAFIAGLRYGRGRLAMKDGRMYDVYWQGPSLGYDFGATGSRVMFLVYGIEQPGDVFQRFAGIDGSAYVVGGAGITFLKRGKIIMAPIRTGLGLRIGANVGYLKFTPDPSLNPF